MQYIEKLSRVRKNKEGVASLITSCRAPLLNRACSRLWRVDVGRRRGHQRINLTIDQVAVDRGGRSEGRTAAVAAAEEEHKNNYNFKAASDIDDGRGGGDDDGVAVDK